MAGNKKKKKPAANPARGFATQSLPSKPRPEAVEASTKAPEPTVTAEVPAAESANSNGTSQTSQGPTVAAQLSPEEFERELEESALQELVEKSAQRAKRDAARQVTRLQTDRRLLRSQADSLNTRKWLPPDQLDGILNLVAADQRSATQALLEGAPTQKPLSEDDLVIKLWTLQQTLEGAGFPDNKVRSCVTYILSISDKVSLISKDSIWGLEESLQWLANECSRDELPDYENWQTKVLQGLKSQLGKFLVRDLSFKDSNKLYSVTISYSLSFGHQHADTKCRPRLAAEWSGRYEQEQ
jgi:ATP-dependent RNA helicase DHX29